MWSGRAACRASGSAKHAMVVTHTSSLTRASSGELSCSTPWQTSGLSVLCLQLATMQCLRRACLSVVQAQLLSLPWAYSLAPHRQRSPKGKGCGCANTVVAAQAAAFTAGALHSPAEVAAPHDVAAVQDQGRLLRAWATASLPLLRSPFHPALTPKVGEHKLASRLHN